MFSCQRYMWYITSKVKGNVEDGKGKEEEQKSKEKRMSPYSSQNTPGGETVPEKSVSSHWLMRRNHLKMIWV